jgi:hypothetical protein
MEEGIEDREQKPSNLDTCLQVWLFKYFQDVRFLDSHFHSRFNGSLAMIQHRCGWEDSKVQIYQLPAFLCRSHKTCCELMLRFIGLATPILSAMAIDNSS